jgi:lysophospholipase L1-like esterase
MSYTPTGTTTGTLVASDDSRIGAGGPSYGLTPQNFKKWRKVLAKVRTGESQAKIFCLGDSITFGEGATFGTNPIYRNCWPKRLAELLNAQYIPADVGLATGGTGAPVADTRFTLGTGWTYATPNFGFGNHTINGAAAAAGNLVFSPTHPCNTADIYYASAAGSFSSCSVSIDGGATTTLTSSGSLSLAKVTKSLGSVATNHTITLSAPTTPGGFNYFMLVGIDAYDNTTTKVRVSTTGVAGTMTTDWMNSGNAVRSIESLQTYAPDLTIINLGVNDASTPLSLATYISNMGTIITAAQASGDVLLTGCIPTDPVTFPGRATVELDYSTNGLKSLSNTYGCGVVDWNARWVDYATANAAGYMQDTIHPTAAGYADMAQALVNAIRSI